MQPSKKQAFYRYNRSSAPKWSAGAARILVPFLAKSPKASQGGPGSCQKVPKGASWSLQKGSKSLPRGVQGTKRERQRVKSIEYRV